MVSDCRGRVLSDAYATLRPSAGLASASNHIRYIVSGIRTNGVRRVRSRRVAAVTRSPAAYSHLVPR